jgi:hypothetical protein
MASSGLQVSDQGLVVTDQGLLVTDGTETNAGTCCCTGGGYRQARWCSDDTLANVWMTTDDAVTLTGSFKIGSNCFYFNFADATSDTAGGTTFTLTDVVATYAACADCCLCCENLIVTITAPAPAAQRGVFDLHRVAGCEQLTDLEWTTVPPFDADSPSPGMFVLFASGGDWHYRQIDADGIEVASGTGQPATVCPEDGTYPAGLTIECAD